MKPRTPHATGSQFLVLCGPMGAGKSTVGSLLAARLGWRHVDTDSVLEHALGSSLGDYFRLHGEASFRASEARHTLELLGGEDPLVVSLGGGTLDSDAVLSRCSLPDVRLVWLRIQPQTALIRLSSPLEPERPLWNVHGIDGWRRLVERRSGAWSRAQLAVDVDELTPMEVVDTICEYLGVRDVR
jgi:shikimate kinase